MNGVVLALGSLAVFVAAYALYSRLLDRRLFRLDPQRITPSHAQQDNIDFCPTRPLVLFGHHFAEFPTILLPIGLLRQLQIAVSSHVLAVAPKSQRLGRLHRRQHFLPRFAHAD